MAPDRFHELEAKVDALADSVHALHVEIVREIRDVITEALDRHIVQCPTRARVDRLNGGTAPRSAWERLTPWLVAVAGFTLGALAVSGIVGPDALAALLPF